MCTARSQQIQVARVIQSAVCSRLRLRAVTRASRYGDLKDSADVAKLHEELRPLLLRRMKEHVDQTIKRKVAS
jgi:hypothetical protein